MELSPGAGFGSPLPGSGWPTDKKELSFFFFFCKGNCFTIHQPALSLGDSLPVNVIQLSGCLSKSSSFAFHCRLEKKNGEDIERRKRKQNPNSQCKAVEIGHLAPISAFQYLP